MKKVPWTILATLVGACDAGGLRFDGQLGVHRTGNECGGDYRNGGGDTLCG